MIALGLGRGGRRRERGAFGGRRSPSRSSRSALTVWMLGRGDRYSAPDLLAGAFVAIAIELALLIAGTLVAFAPRAP